MAISINTSAWQTGSNSVASTTLVLSSIGGVSAGQYAFVAVSIATTTASISSITDNLGNTYSRQSFLQNAAGVRVELWAAQVVTGSITTLTITVSVSSLMAACVVVYAGVASLGNIETAGGTGTILVNSLTTQDTGNWNVAAFGFVCASGDSITQTFGTRERYVVPSLASVGCALIDASYTGPGLSIESINTRGGPVRHLFWRPSKLRGYGERQALEVETEIDGRAGAGRVCRVRRDRRSEEY